MILTKEYGKAGFIYCLAIYIMHNKRRSTSFFFKQNKIQNKYPFFLYDSFMLITIYIFVN